MVEFFSINRDWGKLSVMKITEDIEFYMSYLDLTDHDIQEYESISHQQKKEQWAASRYLLKKISNETKTLYLEKNTTGKPKFINLEAKFSISHSDEYVAVIFSYDSEVAIDIECYDDKILRVQNKFLHPSEYNYRDNVIDLCTLWSIKETVYKYYDTKHLVSFKENLILSEMKDNSVIMDISIADENYSKTVYYEKFKDLVLSYIVE